jgi:hypothetical protein
MTTIAAAQKRKAEAMADDHDEFFGEDTPRMVGVDDKDSHENVAAASSSTKHAVKRVRLVLPPKPRAEERGSTPELVPGPSNVCFCTQSKHLCSRVRTSQESHSRADESSFATDSE